MNDLKKNIEQARKLLSQNDAVEALQILKPYRKSLKTINSQNLELQAVFAEVYLENGKAEKAYPLLVNICELDPDGKKGGNDKFFTLGQITGGSEGIQLIYKGIENVSNQSGDEINESQIKKIIGGLLSMIEIWMTDLCMEPEAEEQCEELINKAIEISNGESGEVWLSLGSIRISQQRFEEAIEAFKKSWEFFEKRKIELEQDSGNIKTQLEYIELLQPLLNLGKMCVEMGEYEVALKICNSIKDIDEDNLECYYLEGFSNYLLAKVNLYKDMTPENERIQNIYEFNEKFQELPIDYTNPKYEENIHESRVAFSFLLTIAQNNPKVDEISMELIEGAKNCLEEMGNVIITMEQLMELRKGANVNEDDVAILNEFESEI